MSQNTKTEQEANSPKPKSHSRGAADLVISEYGKIPPQAIDLEEAVLGAMMLERDTLATVVDLLDVGAFYKESHKLIFKAIFNLYNRMEPVDILTVTNELKSQGNLDMVGGAYYISQLTNRISSGANAEFHARIILQKKLQRDMIVVGSQMGTKAFEDTADALDLLDWAQKELFDLANGLHTGTYSHVEDLCKDAIDQIKANQSKNSFTGLPSGFTDLDRLTSGWQDSNLIIIAARPGMGKTAFALSLARNAAQQFDIPVAIFSLEMSKVELVLRLISMESRICSQKIKNGSLSNSDWNTINNTATAIENAPVIIDDTAAIGIFELRAKARRMRQQYGIEMIIIDYIQLMTSDDENKTRNRENEISLISRSLKQLAKELEMPVIALSQLNRSVETRGGSKKPMLSDLRESGAIEQDADVVAFIYRPEYYQIDQDDLGNSTEGMAEVIIAKQRNGPTGEVKLYFEKSLTLFSSINVSQDVSDNIDIAENNHHVDTIPATYYSQHHGDSDETPF